MRARFAIVLAMAALAAAGRAAPVEITYMGWGNPQERQISENLLAAFEKANPDIKVKYIHASDFESKLRTMMAGDIPPDVFYMPAESFAMYASKGVLKRLDGLIQDARFPIEDFFPPLVDGFRYNGGIYGIPKDFTTQVVYYNRDLFDRDNVPYPRAGWTWNDLLDAAKRLTHDFDGDGRIDQFGLQYNGGNPGTYCYFRQAGARLFTKDGRRLGYDSPEGLEALTFLHDLDYKHHVALSTSAAAGRDAQAEFSNGRLAMFMGYGRWLTPRFRQMNKFRWDVAPMPKGRQRFSILFTVAYSISAKTRHPAEAFRLVSFLTGPEGQALNSRLGLAIPALRSVAYGPAFLDPKSTINDRAFLADMDVAEVYPRTPNYQELDQIIGAALERVLTLNKETPAEGLERLSREVAAYLEKYRVQRAYPPVPWRRLGALMGILVLAMAVAVGLGLRRSGPMGRLARAEERIGYLFILPWLLGFLAFGLFPIVTSLLLSFAQWDAVSPLATAQWVGWDNYRQAFTAEPKFWQALRVTGLYSVVSVPIGLVLSVAMAVLLNQKVRGIPLFRTLFYLPSLVGGVSVAVLWWRIFNRDFGVLNYVLMKAGIYDLAGAKPIDWLGSEQWALPAMIIMSLWGVGGGMLIYLAGLQGIPTQLYEAASIDGATNWRKFRVITLPMLSPVIFFNLIMGIIGSFQVFTQAYVMTGGGPNNATLFYVLYLYQKGFQQFQMGYASALAWVLFAIVLILTALVMRSSRSWVHYEGAKE
jgi:multiple sugar transport system permease protein